MTKERNRWLSAYAVLIYAFLFAPIVVLIIFSFNSARRGLVWRGFTLDWYPRLFSNDELLDALIVTLQVAFVAVLVSTILGSLLGLGLARMKFRGRGATETLLLVPMLTPEIVMGLALLLFFLQLFDAHGSIPQLWVAHITFCISYVAVVVRARATSMNAQLEEAARDLGASAWGAFRYVTLPQLRSVLLVTLILQLIATAQLFTEPLLFTSGGPNNATLTVLLLIYRYAFQNSLGGDYGMAAALSLMLAAFLALFTAGYYWLTRSWSTSS